MGWGTDFTAEIFLNREVFSSNSDLEYKIEELKQFIENHKKEISMYVSANPKDIIPDDWKEDGLNFLIFKLKEIFENYEADLIMLAKLEMLQDTCLVQGIDVSTLKS
jgi:hypothetical protein